MTFGLCLLRIKPRLRPAVLITILVTGLGWTVSAQIKSAPATNTAVKLDAPGFVGSQSCRECHEKFYAL